LARHRMEGERQVVRQKAAAIALSVGTLAGIAGVANAATGTSPGIVPMAGSTDLAAAFATSSAPAQNDDGPIRTVHAVNAPNEARNLLQAEQVQAQYHVGQALKFAQDGYGKRQEAIRAEQARIAAEEAAKRPKCVKPTQGSFTSGFGARWGASHNGIDIANAIGTPILSVMDGTVIEAGPASGFGLWVRVQHDDGTITVYGHVNTITAQKGTKVRAGDQIATMGNRGQSTGPHLHFEVWVGGGQKINPVGWLAERGVKI
jgi:murein DD-endopeptidase MepM/ murein hydrolase activator NlpD